ncbi:unnamed protein product [Nezara viridula]|uniref:Uncharacterized protein n=1 Tax=Nezara viridula TaxID=85310 RepID=A0A9P0E3C9_NEZVI|nr:unnamed protein product [Nezara viridula]
MSVFAMEPLMRPNFTECGNREPFELAALREEGLLWPNHFPFKLLNEIFV